MGKIIAITGVTRGLGRALVPQFVTAGHVVAGCGRSQDHVAQLEAEFTAPHQFAAVDVTDAEALGQWAKGVLAKLGPPDLLINNAAVMNSLGSLWTIPVAEFDRVIDVNVKGVVNSIRAFVPAMVAHRKRRHRQSLERLGTFDGSGSRTVLHLEVRRRRPDAGDGAGAAQGDGGNSVEPWRHRH